MSDKFLTIKGHSDGEYKEKGSKFLAHAYPVATEEEVKLFIDELKKEHYNARHHCYAFVIGHPDQYYRANDDGEPTHSAGDPILRQIQSLKLTNTLVVVVRYFGGTKLGVSGLVNAYKTAAASALHHNTVIPKYLTETITFSYEYDQTNLVMKIIDEFDAAIIEQDFQASVTMKVRVKKSYYPHFLSALENANISLVS